MSHFDFHCLEYWYDGTNRQQQCNVGVMNWQLNIAAIDKFRDFLFWHCVLFYIILSIEPVISSPVFFLAGLDPGNGLPTQPPIAVSTCV